MNDAEREERAIWKLGEAGCAVRRKDGWWIVTDRATSIETARMDNLAALAELADALYGPVWTGRGKITPSA